MQLMYCNCVVCPRYCQVLNIREIKLGTNRFWAVTEICILRVDPTYDSMSYSQNYLEYEISVSNEVQAPDLNA